MSKIAAKLLALDPAKPIKPRKLDRLLDDDDKKAVFNRYQAGCSVRTLRDALNAAGVDITDNPIIDLLKREGVYRAR